MGAGEGNRGREVVPQGGEARRRGRAVRNRGKMPLPQFSERSQVIKKKLGFGGTGARTREEWKEEGGGVVWITD
ncbi:MAG: hypothetical protein OXN17_02730 [Candidatus Poribacteria bacterium]|nr:hypothetical protein [Candidatus Poribacteria bacterium]